MKLRTRISFVRQLHWPHRQATEILSVLVLLVFNVATLLNFCWFMSSRNNVFTLLDISNALSTVALEAGLTSRNFQITMFSPIKKNTQNLGRSFPFSSFLALHHLYVAVNHTSILFHYNAGLYVPVWLRAATACHRSFQILFWDF